ncbi:MAG: Tad domain-containing protein [Candidatus Riflebacteria bacterium]|nr:Tad domain-containing protein [Candidatus Riflebacteria bacterium]
MNQNKSNWRKGSILVMTALSAVFLLSMTAIVTDVSYLYYNQGRLQTAVNAGWKAGYDRMLQISRVSPPTTENQSVIKAHILEVMKANGYTDDELTTVQVEFGPRFHLKVSSIQPVGLFFARIMNFNSSDVAAARENHANDAGQGIIPIAIPNGVVKDLGNMYTYTPFALENDGFVASRTYIIRLGTGGKSSVKSSTLKDLYFPPTLTASGTVEPGMLLIPMDDTQDEPLKAYGFAFWCLRPDDADPGLLTPVQWLLGYKGGAFMVPNFPDAVAMLSAGGTYSGVDYIPLSLETDKEVIDMHLAAAAGNTLNLSARPRIAIYSNSATSELGTLLAQAGIPYGSYSLPGGWNRYVNGSIQLYDPTRNTLVNDAAVLSGALDRYHIVLLDKSEDLTGFSHGCSFHTKCCEDYIRELRYGTTNNPTARGKAEQYMCGYCRNFYDESYKFDFGSAKDTVNYATEKDNVWRQGVIVGGKLEYVSRYNEVRANCEYKNRRCVDRSDSSGVFYYNIVNPGVAPLLCGDTTSQCVNHKALRILAAAQGYSSDTSPDAKPAINPASPITADSDAWFKNANLVQKMKWAVAEKIRAHLALYGHLFAQSFGAETLDLALWQSAIHNGTDANSAYENCLAFIGHTYQNFPMSPAYYSTINNPTAGLSEPFNLLPTYDHEAICQNTNPDPDTAGGYTTSFTGSNLGDALPPTEVTALGRANADNNKVKYIDGTFRSGALAGKYTFLAGDFKNTESKRLLLNNILRMDPPVFCIKAVVGGNVTPIAGKQKSGYGDIDPDNVTGGGVNAYKDNFMFGSNSPIELEDNIITDPGKGGLGGTPDPLSFRLYGGTIDGVYYPPNPFVILPITEPCTNALADGATTVYDLQSNDHPEGIYKDGTGLGEYDFQSSVKVIGFAEFELIPREQWDRIGDDFQDGDIGDLGLTQENDGQIRAKFVRYIIKPGELP